MDVGSNPALVKSQTFVTNAIAGTGFGKKLGTMVPAIAGKKNVVLVPSLELCPSAIPVIAGNRLGLLGQCSSS